LNIDEYFTRTDSSGTGNFLSDALGSTVGLSNSSGAITTSYTYDPFRNVTVSGSANANLMVALVALLELAPAASVFREELTCSGLTADA